MYVWPLFLPRPSFHLLLTLKGALFLLVFSIPSSTGDFHMKKWTPVLNYRSRAVHVHGMDGPRVVMKGRTSPQFFTGFAGV